ncbi:MAG: nucleotide sugar dehydrogenase [Geminicoccaceae bacterium]
MSASGTTSVDWHRLEARFRARQATVGIIGLGYVGLPLAIAAARGGFAVIGFDIDETKVTRLTAGRSYIKHIDGGEVAGLITGGRLRVTSDFSTLSEVDACLICVPTPLTKHREPDLSFVEGTAETIRPFLRPGQLIVLESTTYPGTTRDVLRPLLEREDLRVEEQLFLAYSPEREDPANPNHVTATIPKVVGAAGPRSLKLAQALYDNIVEQTVAVSSLETAEAVKLTENIFRAVNIALVNELKIVFDAMGIDVWEVIDAAKTKPFGFMPFYPGPGLGGHCIPIDPFYLTWKAREYEIPTRFIELAGEVNTAMPRYVVERLAMALDERTGKGLNGSRILLAGIAYKKNVDDMRESPGLPILSMLERRGAEVDYVDPFVPMIPQTREHVTLAGRRSIALEPELFADYDAVLIVTDHDEVDYQALVHHARLVVDTRNATKSVTDQRQKIVKA